MLNIKAKYLAKEMNLVEAAKALTKHNGNPLAGNLTIVKRWK